ncbi:MAG: hypothetical protein IKZ86_08320 [Spirochaetaceae bacterium]|nr:hypothetical protein [Spirochaetaceae bacterium]
MKSKVFALMLALTMAVFALTGCTNSKGEVLTLYDANGLKIEREGAQTRIYDLEGDAEYTFTTHRVKKSTAEPVTAAQTTADTDTITIQTVHGLIIVTSKATGTTLYIK